ncbi:MAG: division/cell wall cluster transcriptional repressor MraZ [bacterium]
MFIGEYQHNLDDKGRLAIPAKFRGQLSEGAVVTKGLDNCLSLFTKEGWDFEAERLMNLPLTQAKARAYARFMLSSAFPVEIDKQGRVNVPQALRSFAGISGSTVVTGLGDHVEIWAPEAWEEYRSHIEKDSGNIAEELGI